MMAKEKLLIYNELEKKVWDLSIGIPGDFFIWLLCKSERIKRREERFRIDMSCPDSPKLRTGNTKTTANWQSLLTYAHSLFWKKF